MFYKMSVIVSLIDACKNKDNEMKTAKSLLLLTLTASLLTACAGEKEIEVAPESTLLQQSDVYLKDEDYTQAIKYLEALNRRFPRTMHSEETQLNLIYAYFEDSDYNALLNTADNFFRHYKNSPYSDYVLYMAGIAREAQNKNIVQDFFGVDPANRDSFSMRSALDNFNTLIRVFPNSQYAPDALERMKYIHALLARHEVNIAKFYAKRNAWVAVANRLVDVQRHYPNTNAALQSLPLLKKAYEKMGLTKLAEDTAQLIAQNEGKSYPELKKVAAPTNIKPPKLAEQK